MLKAYLKSASSKIVRGPNRPNCPLLDLVEVAPVGLNAGDDRTPPFPLFLGHRRAQPSCYIVRTFLGCLNCTKYDAGSVCNKYGEQGSKYHSDCSAPLELDNFMRLF